MQRREFIGLSLCAIASILAPRSVSASTNFTHINYTAPNQNVQTILIFLYGGASQLNANLSNLTEIEAKSQNSYYDYFGDITPTSRGFWKEAGGDALEEMVDNGDMTLFRCCYSQVREDQNNKSHDICTEQNQKGSFDEMSAGILTNLAQILEEKGAVNENTRMPFITLDGDSYFYAQGLTPIRSYLKAMGLDEAFSNPYKREPDNWYYYNYAERQANPDSYYDMTPSLDTHFETMATANNSHQKIKEAFAKREELSQFVETIKAQETPELGNSTYPQNSSFAQRVEAAINIMAHNSDTKVITLSTSGLGGWDDHNEARDYVTRSNTLFQTLKAANQHLKSLNKESEISLMVFGEFGRNVNLNDSFGWDHGNLQNFYLLGGKNYFNHQGVVGESVLIDEGEVNRLYLHPKSGTYTFEPLSIAATIYKIFGITNPQSLTDGYNPINV